LGGVVIPFVLCLDNKLEVMQQSGFFHPVPPRREEFFMASKLVLSICITLGLSLGWRFGSPGGLMGSYLAAVAGASAGLYVGRRLQRWREGED